MEEKVSDPDVENIGKQFADQFTTAYEIMKEFTEKFKDSPKKILFVAQDMQPLDSIQEPFDRDDIKVAYKKVGDQIMKISVVFEGHEFPTEEILEHIRSSGRIGISMLELSHLVRFDKAQILKYQVGQLLRDKKIIKRQLRTSEHLSSFDRGFLEHQLSTSGDKLGADSRGNYVGPVFFALEFMNTVGPKVLEKGR